MKPRISLVSHSLALVTTSVALMTSQACLGAEAAFDLTNYEANYPVYYLRTDALAGADCYVEVLAGPDPADLLPVVSNSQDVSPALPLSMGYFDATIGLVSNAVPNSLGWCQVIAWKGEGAIDGWQKATEWVCSPVFQQYFGMFNPPNLWAPVTFSFPANLVIQPVAPGSGPTLRLTRYGDQVILVWRSFDPGFNVEYTDNLVAPNGVPAAETPVRVGDHNVITTTVTNSARYFRLRK